MVLISDTLRKELYQFLKSRQCSANAGISIYEILGKDKANNFRFVEGIYSFKLMGPHFPIYYFLYTKKNGVTIIKDYTFNGFFTELISFFKKNDVTFTDATKAKYIEAIVHSIGHARILNGYSETIKINSKSLDSTVKLTHE